MIFVVIRTGDRWISFLPVVPPGARSSVDAAFCGFLTAGVGALAPPLLCFYTSKFGPELTPAVRADNPFFALDAAVDFVHLYSHSHSHLGLNDQRILDPRGPRVQLCRFFLFVKGHEWHP